MSKYIISLDPGKDTTKAMGIEITECLNFQDEATLNRIHKESFRSRVYDMSNGYIDVEGEKSHKVVFNNQTLAVGDQGGQQKSYNTSKNDPLHQICAYTAVTQYLKPGTKDNKIYLVLTCPITMLKSDIAKLEYKTFIKGEGPIKINVDGDDYEFEIDEILLKAEGSGIVYLRPDLFKGKKVAVLDFGGLNLTVTLFTNGVCANPERDRFAEEFGAIQLINYVSSDLTQYNKGNIVRFETAEEALLRGYALDYGKKDVNSVEPIKRAKSRFFNDACSEVARHGLSLKDLDSTAFVGGTTQNLVEEITSSLPNNIIAENSQWTNVEGLFKIAAKKYSYIK